jgi:hypothetical protein
MTPLNALRQMFKSKEEPPLALEAESSNWRPWAYLQNKQAIKKKKTMIE